MSCWPFKSLILSHSMGQNWRIFFFPSWGISSLHSSSRHATPYVEWAGLKQRSTCLCFSNAGVKSTYHHLGELEIFENVSSLGPENEWEDVSSARLLARVLLSAHSSCLSFCICCEKLGAKSHEVILVLLWLESGIWSHVYLAWVEGGMTLQEQLD